MTVSGQTIVGTSPNAASIGATVTKKFTPGLVEPPSAHHGVTRPGRSSASFLRRI
jgi:hypothetical protein